MQKRSIAPAGAVLLMLASLAPALAQETAWPVKPLRLIAPFPPGGAVDNLSRLASARLQDLLLQPVVVESRTGAGGVIGSDIVAKAAPDGYTLLLASLASQVIAPVVQKTPYQALGDFTYIALLGGSPTTITAGPALPVRDLKEFIALAQARPDTISYGTPGNGTHAHLITEVFKTLTRTRMNHIPYKGSGPALIDLIAGHLPALVITFASVGPYIKAGKVRALASTAAKRLPDYPEVPTFAELGYAELTALTWFALAGPRGLPEPITIRLNREIRSILATTEMREKMRAESFETLDLDVPRFNDYVAAEVRRWQPVARAAGVKSD